MTELCIVGEFVYNIIHCSTKIYIVNKYNKSQGPEHGPLGIFLNLGLFYLDLFYILPFLYLGLFNPWPFKILAFYTLAFLCLGFFIPWTFYTLAFLYLAKA